MKAKCPFLVSFYIRKNKNCRRDYSIYCCIKVEDSTSEVCVVNSLKKDHWDLRKGRPKQTTDELIKLTMYLDMIKTKLSNIYFDLKLSGNGFNSSHIKNIYLGKSGQQISILQLTDLAIEKYKNEFLPGTLKNYKATRYYIETFCKQKYKSGDVHLRLLTYSFIEELKIYILANPIKPNDPCTNNGCMKHLERIKKILSWGYEMRFIDRDVFATYKVKKKKSEQKCLYWPQLKALETKTLQRPMLSLVKDLFLFCCYTGMAPVDMQNLKPHQIIKETEGLFWLFYCRSKSKVSAKVPLLNLAVSIINKYELTSQDPWRTTVFPFVTNKDLNANLKIIGEICEIGMPLNFYMARHTFATTITLSLGVPITSIKEMMGHDRIETTMLYAQANTDLVSDHMKLAQARINERNYLQNDSVI